MVSKETRVTWELLEAIFGSKMNFWDLLRQIASSAQRSKLFKGFGSWISRQQTLRTLQTAHLLLLKDIIANLKPSKGKVWSLFHFADFPMLFQAHLGSSAFRLHQRTPRITQKHSCDSRFNCSALQLFFHFSVFPSRNTMQRRLLERNAFFLSLWTRRIPHKFAFKNKSTLRSASPQLAVCENGEKFSRAQFLCSRELLENFLHKFFFKFMHKTLLFTLFSSPPPLSFLFSVLAHPQGG